MGDILVWVVGAIGIYLAIGIIVTVALRLLAEITEGFG